MTTSAIIVRSQQSQRSMNQSKGWTRSPVRETKHPPLVIEQTKVSTPDKIAHRILQCMSQDFSEQSYQKMLKSKDVAETRAVANSVDIETYEFQHEIQESNQKVL